MLRTCFYKFLCLTVLLCFLKTISWAAQSVNQSDLSETAYLDTVNGLSIDDVVTLALQRNPDLLALKQRLAETQGLLKQAGLRPNPNLSGSITDGSIVGSDSEREYSIDYIHTFEMGGKRDKRIQLVTIESELARYEIAEKERELTADTKTAYVEALTTIRKLKVLQQTFDLIQKTNDVTIQRVREGEAPALEQGLSTMELNRIQADLALEASTAQSQMFTLKALYAADLDDKLLLKGDWQFDESKVNLQGLVQQALTNRPDLLAARLQEKASDAQINLTKAEGVSDLNAFAGYGHSHSQFDQFGLDENGMPVPLTDRDNTLSAGISLNLPFFNRNQGNYQAAVARKEAARLRTKSLEKRIEQEVRSAISVYTASMNAVRTLSGTVVPQSEKNLEIVRATYELGELRFLDLIQEQRRALEIQNSYTEALKTYLLSVVQLENKTGLRLVGKEQ
ncbi:TolC family protein [bacterium]|nr:TolC family protein [bacterium]